MKLIIESGVEYEFRTTVVPGLHDIKNLMKAAERPLPIQLTQILELYLTALFGQQEN